MDEKSHTATKEQIGYCCLDFLTRGKIIKDTSEGRNAIRQRQESVEVSGEVPDVD